MSYTSSTLRDLLKWEHLVLGTDLIPKQRVTSILAGKHSSMMRGRGLDFEEVRNYVPGDDIRNIDWKVTARTRKAHTKVFNEEKERPALVIVDQSSFMHFGSSLYLKSVIAAEAAALAAFRTIKKGDRCGGMVISDDNLEWFAPKRSRLSVLQLLKSVSKYNQALSSSNSKVVSNKPAIQKALNRVANYVTHDFVISIISDFSQFDDNIYKTIKQLARHNDVVCVHIEDDLDMVTPINNTIISDGEKQIFWRKSPLKTIKKESDEENRFKERLNTLKRKFQIPVVTLTTKEPLVSQIRYIFKNR